MKKVYGTLFFMGMVVRGYDSASPQSKDCEVIQFLRNHDVTSTEAIFGGDWFYGKYPNAYKVLVHHCGVDFDASDRVLLLENPHFFLATFPEKHAVFRGRACWLAEQVDPFFIQDLLQATRLDQSVKK